MNQQLRQLLEDREIQSLLRRKLPYIFTIANIENSRGGKVGMEVGNARERILISFLTWKLGEQNVATDIPTTQKDVDVSVFDQPISIKTFTGIITSVKASWTVDAPSVAEFLHRYRPASDLLLAQIRWDLTDRQLATGTHPGGLFHIPTESQLEILKRMGPEAYVQPPKIGTNPRGPVITSQAVKELLVAEGTLAVSILWKKAKVSISPYTRWLDYWKDGEP